MCPPHKETTINQNSKTGNLQTWWRWWLWALLSPQIHSKMREGFAHFVFHTEVTPETRAS